MKCKFCGEPCEDNETCHLGCALSNALYKAIKVKGREQKQ